MTSREVDRDALLSEDRLQQGYVIILPGVEGHSSWNRWIKRGLLEAGIPYAMEIHDWTLGPLWYLWNLRDGRRHREQAERIAAKIVDYRERYPTQPVWLIGHSGGGAMTAFTLEHLPEGVKATGGILLVSALSPRYDLTQALRHTDRGLWNYSAFGDLFFVGIGTVVCGTCDGKHVPAAGLVGLRNSAARGNGESDTPQLHQMWFRPGMLRDFNVAGHLSCTNPRFVSKWIAPIVLEDARQADAATAQTARAR